MDTLTKIGNTGTEAVALYGEITRLLQQLQAALQSPKSVVAALQAYAAQPDPTSVVGVLVDKLGIDPAPLLEFITKNKGSIDTLLALFQPVQQFGAHTLSFPLHRTGVPATGLSLQGAADLAATVEADTDGVLVDKMVEFDKDRETFLHFGVEGKLEGSASGAAPVGSTVTVQGAFEVGATLSINNYFRHAATETTLAALAADVPEFTLPGRLGGGGAGATLLSSLGPDGRRIPGQYVRINGTGLVKLGGSVTWGRSFLSAANVSEKGLDLTTKVDVGLSATASFSYQLNGTFDILVSASPSPVEPPRVRVKLAKSQTSTRDVGLQLGANIEIDGLDQAGRAVLSGFLPKLDAIIQEIDKTGNELSDLRGLFAAKLDGELDTLLAKQTVTDQIQSFLKLIAPNLDLRAKLKELASQAVLGVIGVAGPQIDALESNLQPVTNAFKELVRKYRNAVDKINAALQLAAHAKIGIAFALNRQRVESAAVALEFEIDPERDHALYLRLLQGDFAAAIAASRDASTSLTVIGGELKEAGALTRTSTLTLTALGKFEIDQVSILAQSWETVVSPTGDITLGVHGEVQDQTKLLHEMRTATFLADARVLGMLMDNGTLSGASFDDKVSLELTHELTPTQDSAVVAEERTLRALGVLTDQGVSLVKDLVFKPAEPKKRFGTLLVSAFLELGRADLEALLTADANTAQREFVTALGQFTPNLEWLQVQDGSKTLPFLLWPSVRVLGQSGFNTTGLSGSREFQAPDGTAHNVPIGALPLVRYGVLLAADFRQAFSALRGLSGTGPFNETRDQLLARLRNQQMALLDAIQRMITPPGMFDRYRISQALFQTLFRLSRLNQGSPAPFVSIKRQDDGKVFVYA